MQQGVNVFNKLSLHCEFNLSCNRGNWEHPDGVFALYRTSHWKRTVRLFASREFTLSEMKNSELPTTWENTWYWFLAWHGFLCGTTVPTCCPGENNNNNKSHNHCNLWQLQLSRLLSCRFQGTDKQLNHYHPSWADLQLRKWNKDVSITEMEGKPEILTQPVAACL